MKDKVQLFEENGVRSAWDEEKEEWFFSVIDVVAALTLSVDPKRYWSVLKSRISKELDQPTTICSRLRMKANDGKMRLTDVATAEQLLRIIQSIPSPKAEPFKRWLARVGAERMEEEVDPQKAIDRARATYLAKGYPEPWIKARLQGIQARNELTDEWKAHGVQDLQYAILTNIIHRGTFDLSVREHKALKGLKKENLRDNMTPLESALTTLAEVTATEITRAQDPHSIEHHKKIAEESGSIAKRARLDVEKQTGKSVVSSQNAKDMLSAPEDITGEIKKLNE